MSDSVRPHRRQPTRLHRPWDSPGKNTGVGCHFLLQCMKVKSEREVAESSPTLSDPMDCGPPGSSTHGIFQARVLEWDAIAFSDRCIYVYVYINANIIILAYIRGTWYAYNFKNNFKCQICRHYTSLWAWKWYNKDYLFLNNSNKCLLYIFSAICL